MDRRAVLAGMVALPLLGEAGFAESCVELHPNWEFVADTVMGGVSTGQVVTGIEAGVPVARLTGDVSLENNGGFIQMASDLSQGGGALDASAFDGIAFEARGNGEPYEVAMRTTELARPWHSYRASFVAGAQWQRVEIPFADFAPNRTEVSFDPSKLRRVGILAVGRVVSVDVRVRGLCLWQGERSG